MKEIHLKNCNVLQGFSRELYAVDSKEQIKLWCKEVLHTETAQKR